MNNQLSYCGLVDAKIRASDKDLPVSFDRRFLKVFPFEISNGRSCSTLISSVLHWSKLALELAILIWPLLIGKAGVA